ncbi:MAG: cytochrome c3 family protein [Nitrospirae bacterium]|nr:cytochrome c3 family protein [Nitrospirota bacterium]
MNKLLVCLVLFLYSVSYNVSSLQCGEISDTQLKEGKDIGFFEVHSWPGSRCNVCHISSSPDTESALLNNTDQSQLCESCHKGTVTILPSLRLKSEVKKMANHPIKFSPMDFDPNKINHNIIKEDNHFYVSGSTGQVPIFGATPATAVAECTTCHESHGKTKTPKMLRISNSKGELCLVCHVNIDLK